MDIQKLNLTDQPSHNTTEHINIQTAEQLRENVQTLVLPDHMEVLCHEDKSDKIYIIKTDDPINAQQVTQMEKDRETLNRTDFINVPTVTSTGTPDFFERSVESVPNCGGVSMDKHNDNSKSFRTTKKNIDKQLRKMNIEPYRKMTQSQISGVRQCSTTDTNNMYGISSSSSSSSHIIRPIPCYACRECGLYFPVENNFKPTLTRDYICDKCRKTPQVYRVCDRCSELCRSNDEIQGGYMIMKRFCCERCIRKDREQKFSKPPKNT
jgi:hypothetical protein